MSHRNHSFICPGSFNKKGKIHTVRLQDLIMDDFGSIGVAVCLACGIETKAVDWEKLPTNEEADKIAKRLIKDEETCSCDFFSVLIVKGCQCGAFKKELQSRKKSV